MQQNKHFETKFKRNVVYLFLVHPGWSPWHQRMPERFWDMQHNKNVDTKFKRNAVYLVLVHPGWSPWHHRMSERFWDMQHNKHFETEVKTNVDIFSWSTQVGAHGITVCLSASGICNITNILRQNFRQVLISFPGSPRLESLASPFAWALLGYAT